MAPAFSRRNLFRLKPGEYFQLFREIGATRENPVQSTRVRPPGALPNEDEFLSVCERCQECSRACPHQVIEHLGPIAGLSEGTPYLNLEQNPCRWCPSMDCIQACPSGALSFGPDRTVSPIGKAKLNWDACLNAQGILCDTCAVYCPASVNAISMTGRRPKVDADACVGCGLCAYVCEATPGAFTVEPHGSLGFYAKNSP